MNGELLGLALMVGAANWAFRAVPILIRTDRQVAEGWVERFLSATGPAAIATLFVAAILPALSSDITRLLPFASGTGAVLATWHLRRSVVLATLAGAFAHGVAFWLVA